MEQLTSVEIPLRVSNGKSDARLRVSVLPKDEKVDPFPLVRVSTDDADQADAEPIQLLEGVEYLYEFVGPTVAISSNQPSVVIPDDRTGRRGRIRPGLHTG